MLDEVELPQKSILNKTELMLISQVKDPRIRAKKRAVLRN